MLQVTTLAAGGGFFLLTMFGVASAAEQQFSCTGQMIEPTGEAKAPIDLTLSLGGPKDKTTIEVHGSEKLNVRVTSDNKIQLKFETKQYVGEFFYYTNDLFLIYKSEHLAQTHLFARLRRSHDFADAR